MPTQIKSGFLLNSTNPVVRSLIKAAAICALPAVQLLFFRWYLHAVLTLRPGFRGFVDADLVLPVFFSLAIYIFILERNQRIELAPKRGWLISNAIASSLFLIYNLTVTRHTSMAGPLWWSLCGVMVLTALFSFWSLSAILGNRYRWAAIPCALSAASVLIIQNIYIYSWPIFGKLSATLACHVLRELDGNTACRWKSQYYLGIVNKPLYALIGPACGGAEILALFGMCLSIYAFTEIDRSARRALPLLCVAAILFAVFLNVFRIVAIFTASTALNHAFPEARYGNRLLGQFFHTHAGWFLYFVGVVFFFWVVERLRFAIESNRRVRT